MRIRASHAYGSRHEAKVGRILKGPDPLAHARETVMAYPKRRIRGQSSFGCGQEPMSEKAREGQESLMLLFLFLRLLLRLLLICSNRFSDIGSSLLSSSQEVRKGI